MTLKELSASDYERYASTFPYRSFMQTREMAELFNKRGYQTYYLGWEADGDIQVTALLFSIPMAGGLHMEVNSGPASSDTKYLNPFYRALQTYAKQKGALELIVKPYDTYQTFDSHGQSTSSEQDQLIADLTSLGYSHDGLLTGYPGGEPDWHYIKDLSNLTEKTLLKSFTPKGRSMVKKSKTFGTKVRTLKRDELSLFTDITSSTSERREYSDKPLDYYQDFYDSWGDKAQFTIASINFQDYLTRLETDQASILTQIKQLEDDWENTQASYKKNNLLKELKVQNETFETRKGEAHDLIAKYGQDEIVLAGSLFIYTPQEVVYLFSGSYTEFNKFYAPALLQEYVMLEAIKRGIPHYNLLGILGEFDNKDGVLRFKQNFNGYITRKMGTFRYYPNPIKHKAIQGLKKILGR